METWKIRTENLDRNAPTHARRESEGKNSCILTVSGIVRDPYVLKMAENKPEGSTAADLVRFQNRQYSLDERRKEQSGLSKEPDVLYEQKSK